MTAIEADEHQPAGDGEAPGALTPVVLRLAGPIVIERMSVSVLAAVDTLLVGNYVNADAVAAVGITILLFWIPFAGAFGLELAATAVIARDYGAGTTVHLLRTLRMIIILAVAWGGLWTVLFWVFAGPLMTLMAAEADTHTFGVEYMRTASLGFPLLMALYAIGGALRGIGNTVLPMLIVLVLNVANALVSFLLISGVIGIELEVVASGLGFTAGSVVGGLLAFAVAIRGVGALRFDLRQSFRTGTVELRRLANIGLPATLEEIQFMAAFIVYSRVITGLGSSAQAAHSIALRALEIVVVPGFALGAASTSLVSRYLGAAQPEIANRAATISAVTAVIIGGLMGGLLALFAPQVVGLIVDDPEVIATGTRLLRVFAIAFPLLSLFASLSGALRGAGDARYVLAVITTTAWFVRIPVALILVLVFGFGAAGAWAGATVEHVVRTSIIVHRFRRGDWRTREV